MFKGVVRNSNQREAARSVLVVYLETLHIDLLELAGRLIGKDGFDAQENIFSLILDECVATGTGALPRRFAAQHARERHRQLSDWAAVQEPDTITEHGEVPVAATMPVALVVDVWSGTAVGADSVQGLVRLVDHVAADTVLQAGDILVAPSTDPVWTPLFLKVDAVVMGTGGYLPHDAIVIHEFGTPAVVNISDIRAQLKDGEAIRVDDNTGMVSRMTDQSSRYGDEATLASANYCGAIFGLTFGYSPAGLSLSQSSEGIVMNIVALKAALTLRFARFWQIVRREASRVVALYAESHGMMVKLCYRSDR